MDIGNRIRQLRKDRGLTQGQLAIKMGYKNSSSIARMEMSDSNAQHKISDKIAEKLAKALDTTPEYILWGVESNMVEDYYSTFKNVENDLDVIDKLKLLLREDEVAGKYEYSEDQLGMIISYARFVGQNNGNED